MAEVSPPGIAIVYGLWIKILPNQNPKYFWNCVWSL